MNARLLAEERRIFTCRAGSHAYGLNTHTSDEDTRGVFVGSPSNACGLFPVENVEYDGDYIVFELRKFVSLAKDCNPNIIELLYIHEDDILFSHPLWERLRESRDLFLTRRAKHTFSGYAVAQLKKIRGHKAWVMNPQPKEAPLPAKFVKTKYIEGLGQREVFDQMAYDEANKRWKQYWEWKENRNPKRAAMEEQSGYDCYSADTQFLTSNGWKFYDEIVGSGLKLATVYLPRPDGKSQHRRALGVEFEAPLDCFDGTFNGRMHHFVGHHTDILVTPNHRMLARPISRKTGAESAWTLEEAAHLPDCFDVLTCIAPRTTVDQCKALFEDLPVPATTYLSLMGWYLSDGTFTMRGEIPHSCRISQKKGGKLSWHLARFLSANQNVNASLYEYERAPNLINPNAIIEQILDVRHPELIRRLLLDCGRGEKKRIPRWVFGLSKRLMETLLVAMLRGDGTVRECTPDKSAIYYSSSRELADDVQELAFFCGFETALWGPFVSSTLLGQSTMFQVHINPKAAPTRRLIRNQNVRHEHVENQRIVCFCVPNGTLITRRNGRVAIQGNSKHAMHLIRLLLMGREILRGEGVIVKRSDRDYLLSIRNGAFEYEEIVARSDELIAELETLYETAPLPHDPDVEKIDALLVSIYRDFWRERGEL
jgi:predicted nucleotidyltransferase